MVGGYPRTGTEPDIYCVSDPNHQYLKLGAVSTFLSPSLSSENLRRFILMSLSAPCVCHPTRLEN